MYILSDALNFQLEIRNPSDGEKWGSPKENGDWSGLTGDLTKKKAHMGVANLFIHILYLEVSFIFLLRRYISFITVLSGLFVWSIYHD